MSILPEEEYELMWQTAQEYNNILEDLQEEGEVSVEEVGEKLEYEDGEIDEAIDQLIDKGLVQKRGRSDKDGVYFRFRVTSLGREILGYTERRVS